MSDVYHINILTRTHMWTLLDLAFLFSFLSSICIIKPVFFLHFIEFTTYKVAAWLNQNRRKTKNLLIDVDEDKERGQLISGYIQRRWWWTLKAPLIKDSGTGKLISSVLVHWKDSVVHSWIYRWVLDREHSSAFFISSIINRYRMPKKHLLKFCSFFFSCLW